MIREQDPEPTDEEHASLLAPVFLEVGGRELTGRDLLAAGVVSGRWQRLERELFEGLGLVAAQRPPAAETRQEVQAFRLWRRLLSAEDMRAWLRARGLTIGAVNSVAERSLARRRGGAAGPVVAAEARAALAPEAICTGALLEVGWWLADRILSAAARELTVEPIGLEDRRVQRLVLEELRTVVGDTIRDSGLERGQRLAWIAALDDAHHAWEESITGAREVQRLMREHELDWCRLEFDELRLAFPGAAAEAARQLAEGSSPHDVGAAAGVPVAGRRLLLVDASPELMPRLAGAVAGDVIGPWGEGDEHAVARVRSRTLPDPGDRELLARAQQELVADGCGRLRAGKVTWHERA